MLLQSSPKHSVQFFITVLNILFTPITLSAQELSSPEDAEAYAAYLESLDGIEYHLNKASQTDLSELPGLTPDLAWRITAFRPYSTLEDLQRVPGITDDLLDQITPYLTLKNPIRWQGKLTTRVTRPTNYTNQVDHLRVTQRAEIQLGENISGYVLLDRDPEEPQWPDFITAHVQLTNKFGQFTIGDLRPEIGQGILHTRQTRSSASLSAIRPRVHSRVANRSSTEYGAIRGIHVSTQYRAIHLKALYGKVYWDADISPEGQVGIRRTEQHVSETTRSRKHALTEHLATFHLSLGSPQNHIGLTTQHTSFSPSAPQEITTQHISINAQTQVANTLLFGEFAYAQNGYGYVTGLNWQKHALRLRISMRHYSPHFSPLHGAPIASYGTPPQNEQGIFWGFTYRLKPRTRLEISFDRHKHLIPERDPLPDQGHRFRLILQQRVGKRAQIKLSHSTRNTQFAPKRTENRITLNWPHRALRSTSWISRTTVPTIGNGFAAGIRLQIGQKRQLVLWSTTYNIDAYDARIYDYQPDVWGSGTLQTRSGKGKASGILLVWATGHFRLATRYTVRTTNNLPSSSWAMQIDLRR